MWKDTTSYQQGRERIPTAWTAKAGPVSITVTCAHRMNPGRWTMHCYDLGMDTVDTGLPADVPAETAQVTAKNMAANKAREIASAISKL